MTIGIVRTTWSGITGGQGLTQLAILYQGGSGWTSSFAQSAIDAVRAFWLAQNSLLPNEVILNVQTAVDQYDQATGYLSGTTQASTTPTSVTGTASGSFAAASGYRINWNTGSIRNGRRIYGRTYVVPAASTVYTSSGEISSIARSTAETAASTLLSSLSGAGGSLMVWGRPVTQGDGSGVVTAVQGATVPTKSAVLRERRD